MSKAKKADRELRVLMGLIELYLEEGKPVGSNTLHEAGFEDISSATIRNYFASLEEEGFLAQAHTSGGRVPTAAALKLYADRHAEMGLVDEEDERRLDELRGETKEVAAYLNGALELLSELTGLPTFMSAPRFDHDIVLDIKLLALDATRALAVLMTDFGAILTEVMPTDGKLTPKEIAQMEAYFAWRLTGLDKPEVEVGQKFYNELMVRYVTRYSSYSEPEIHRTGFSRLLNYPSTNLATALSLFENGFRMRKLLRGCDKFVLQHQRRGCGGHDPLRDGWGADWGNWGSGAKPDALPQDFWPSETVLRGGERNADQEPMQVQDSIPQSERGEVVDVSEEEEKTVQELELEQLRHEGKRSSRRSTFARSPIRRMRASGCSASGRRGRNYLIADVGRDVSCSPRPV
jgi:heat-inducible transcriptional repressor